MFVGYCPECSNNVQLKRNDMDICLMIILTIFTAGIGTILYLIIYFSNDPTRCTICNTLCLPMKTKEKVAIPTFETSIPKNKEVSETKKKLNFCPNCGSKLGKASGKPNFCPFCGKELSKPIEAVDDNKKCAVCHQNIRVELDSICCSFCGSLFHPICVSEWLSQHNACPLCQNRFLIPERGKLYKIS